jgi:DNA-binding CsgD family transcriptional regulator/catechol 2,3-dioxygenase-like lactoylglutathione lyase family enzyme
MPQRGRPSHPDQLTPAEWRVVEMVRHGQTNGAIALRLGISADAVKFHVANTLAKLGLKNRLALRHWPGVRRGSPLMGKEGSMPGVLTLGPLGQIARTVKDISAAEAFYRERLELPHLFTFGDLAFFDCGGVRLMLSVGSGEAVADSLLYFRVADIHSAQATLTARGVTFRQAPHLIHKHADGTEEWMAFFDDNEGRPLGLMASMRP